MNRIVLIGNGFDLAHGLPTGYTDFINWYWKNFAKNVANAISENSQSKGFIYKDQFVTIAPPFALFSNHDNEINKNKSKLYAGKFSDVDSYHKLGQVIKALKCEPSHQKTELKFENEFLQKISEKTHLQSWLDIENEYYEILKHYLKSRDRNGQVTKLNKEFCEVKELLEKYLTEVCENKLPNIEPNNDILNDVFLGKGIESRCVALSRQEHYECCLPEQKQKLSEMVHDVIQYEDEHSEQKKLHAMMTRTPYRSNPLCNMNEEERECFIEQAIEQFGVVPNHTLVLNFNYTPTFKTLYAPECSLIQIINIHGELNNPANPIIFGYGDELDEDYKEIERANDNDLLDNIKHIQYPNTDNYRRFLEFLQLGPYQVFIMGHSCGNSDRTLLNTIFEHPHCTSIKPFFYQWADKNGIIKNNYTDLYKNISRNFNNKQNLRDVVANKTYCTLHPQNKVLAE